MSENKSSSLRTTLRSLRFRKEKEGSAKAGSHRRDDQTLSNAAPGMPIKGPVESRLIDAGISQAAKADPVSTTTPSPNVLVSQESATTPSAKVPPPANPTGSAARNDAAVSTPPDQLWDKAYDDLKQDRLEAKLFQLYETILSRRLDSSDSVTGNVIEQDRMKRRSQMNCLLERGLDKTAKLAYVGENIGDVINIVLSVKEAIGGALQAVPIAALAWTGICVALQVFLNPINEMTTNWDGIMHIVRTMKWYSSLAKLLLGDASNHDGPITDLRCLLADRILDLYKAVLKYNVKSVCAYDRHPALTLLRNSVKLDGWTGSLDEVSKAEESVRAAASDYGVRQANSYLGLLVNMHVSQAQDGIMQKLCVTDMTAEIDSLQERKDHLLADSYKWILGNRDYQDFTGCHSSNTKRLLWIKGDPGKGKTMLLIGIVRELTAQMETHFDKSHISYFFCQGTNDKLNTATAILRGLIWMLIRQQKSLLHHLDLFKDLGSTLFEGRTAFYNLKRVLQSMLEDDVLERAYLIIDALDECRKEELGLPQLLELIVEMSGKNDKVKWLVSSRNERNIEMILEEHTAKTRLSLELNAESVASAVEAFIDYKMSELTKTYRKVYVEKKDPKVHEKLQRIQDDVANELRRKADGTFLWVALVFKQIKGCRADKIFERVQKMPSDLYSMYTQMMRQVNELEDAADCKRVLLTMVNTYRPLHLSELVTLAGLSEFADERDIVRNCGLFTIRENDDIVYFVHQSANDYLTKNQNSDVLSNIFPNGYTEGHVTIVSQSLESMEQILHRDVYNLHHPGFPISEVQAPDQDPLASIRYACVYWIDHLCEMESNQDRKGLCNNGTIEVFLKKHFLFWLEALSLLRSLSKGMLSLIKLEGLLMANKSPDLYAFIHDAIRFALYNRLVIEQLPLQLYCSALIFAPEKSVIRATFERYIPAWILIKPKVQAYWSAAIQTLEGHLDGVTSVAFSPNGKQVVSGSYDQTVQLWDAATEAPLHTFKGHSARVTCVAFSPDGKQVVSGSYDQTVQLWDAATGAPLHTFKGHSARVTCVAFSPDGKQVVSGSYDQTVQLWDAATGTPLHTLKSHSEEVTSVAFSSDSRQVVSSSDDQTVQLWDAAAGAPLQTLEGHSGRVKSVAFSLDGRQVVSGSDDETVRVWDTATGASLQTLEGHSGRVMSVAFSLDGKHVVSGSYQTVRLWDAATGAPLQTLEGHSARVTSVAFSPDGKQVVSGSYDQTVRLWDAVTKAPLQTLEGHLDGVTSVAFSPNGKQVVSGSYQTVRLWDAATGAPLQTLEGHSARVTSVAFSPDGKQVVSGSYDQTVRLWDAVTKAPLQTLEGHLDGVTSVAFSPNGKQVVSGSYDQTVQLWDAATGAPLHTLKGHSARVTCVAFSPDGKQVVSGSYDQTVQLWDAATGASLQTLEGHSGEVMSAAFSPDGKQVVSGSDDETIRVWDAATGASLQTLEGHSEMVTSVAFSPDGKHVVSGSYQTVRLWDAATGAPLHTLKSQSSGVRSVAFSPDGKRVNTLLLVSNDWIRERDMKILWLPPDYRSPSCTAIWNGNLVLGYKSGRVSFFGFRSGSKDL